MLSDPPIPSRGASRNIDAVKTSPGVLIPVAKSPGGGRNPESILKERDARKGKKPSGIIQFDQRIPDDVNEDTPMVYDRQATGGSDRRATETYMDLGRREPEDDATRRRVTFRSSTGLVSFMPFSWSSFSLWESSEGGRASGDESPDTDGLDTRQSHLQSNNCCYLLCCPSKNTRMCGTQVRSCHTWCFWLLVAALLTAGVAILALYTMSISRTLPASTKEQGAPQMSQTDFAAKLHDADHDDSGPGGPTADDADKRKGHTYLPIP